MSDSVPVALSTRVYTRTQMQDIAADCAEKGDRYGSVYWSSLSYGDSYDEAVAAALAAVAK